MESRFCVSPRTSCDPIRPFRKLNYTCGIAAIPEKPLRFIYFFWISPSTDKHVLSDSKSGSSRYSASKHPIKYFCLHLVFRPALILGLRVSVSNVDATSTQPKGPVQIPIFSVDDALVCLLRKRKILCGVSPN